MCKSCGYLNIQMPESQVLRFVRPKDIQIHVHDNLPSGTVSFFSSNPEYTRTRTHIDVIIRTRMSTARTRAFLFGGLLKLEMISSGGGDAGPSDHFPKEYSGFSFTGAIAGDHVEVWSMDDKNRGERILAIRIDKMSWA